MNFEESTPPKVNFPFASEVEVEGAKKMPINLESSNPRFQAVSVTVGRIPPPLVIPTSGKNEA